MRTNPYSNLPRHALTLDISQTDYNFIQQQFRGYGDKNFLVSHIKQLIHELRELATSAGGNLLTATLVSAILVEPRRLTDDQQSRVRSALGLPALSSPPKEPEHLPNSRGSHPPRDGVKKAKNKPAKSKGKSSKRQREALSQASEEADEQSRTRD